MWVAASIAVVVWAANEWRLGCRYDEFDVPSTTTLRSALLRAEQLERDLLAEELRIQSLRADVAAELIGREIHHTTSGAKIIRMRRTGA